MTRSDPARSKIFGQVAIGGQRLGAFGNFLDFKIVEARDLADPIDSTEINALREEIRNLKKERDAAILELERERHVQEA